MYTIKQAASRCGVPVQLLRAWERRYGVVTPGRTESGYRLYDEAAIARLRAMRRLVDDGWAPSTAAAHIRELDDAAIAQIAGGLERDALGASTAAQVADSGELAAAFVDSASRLDESAVETILDQMFARGSFERVASEIVMPALVALGDGWATGKVDVAGEHAAANAVQRRLALAFLAAGQPRDGVGPILVGLPPGARHDLGALAFATAARRAGLSVRYLGADLPLADWLEAIKLTGASAIVLGVVIGKDVKAALEVARAVRGAGDDVVVAFGGRKSSAIPTDGLEPVIVLPDGLSEAVDALDERLRVPA